MQFIGSTVWTHNGILAFKVRNKLNVYVVPSQDFLDKHKDPRYFEFFMDFASGIKVRRPAGTQEVLARPYTVITRQVIPGTDQYELVSKDFA